ncbi:MAG: hypothetical protein ACLUHE_11985 [Christensenellales bacterium]
MLKKLMLSSNARPGFGLSPNEKLHIAAQFIIVASLRGFINLFMAKMARGGKLRRRAPCGAEPPKNTSSGEFLFFCRFFITFSAQAERRKFDSSVLLPGRLTIYSH